MSEPHSEETKHNSSGLAVWSLVLGILSLFPLWLLGAIPAVICGHIYLSRIKQSSGELSGRGLAIAGLVIGYFVIAISIIVVIPLMIVFTIGPGMNYLSERRAVGHKVVAYYDDGRKISSNDIGLAQRQLELLKTLGIHLVLQPQDPRVNPVQDLGDIFLGEVLFSERGTAAESISRIRQIVSRNAYGISNKQIDDIYAAAYPPNIYWLLLTKEAQEAGVRTSLETAKSQLETLIPRLQRGATYSQVMGVIIERQGFSEQQALETFADLMGIIEYAKIVCSKQNPTAEQVLHETSRSGETMDVEYVLFSEDAFAEQAQEPGEEKIAGQFEKYKGFLAGDVSKDNPYGFGYKLPDRVKLEYIAVRLDDVAATVLLPTQQETEEYYQQHLSFFTQQVPSDPNDPNSEMVLKTRSYAEVAALISRGLYQQRVDSKAEQILLEAKSITEVNLMEIDRERTKLTGEEVKKLAVDYEKTAEELSEKYKLKVYTGKTGLLSAADVENDKYLGVLYFDGTGFLSESLSQIAFAVEPLKASVLGPFDVQPPLLYENIGPLKDRREAMLGYSGRNMILVRVIEAEKAAEPQNINEKINKHTIVFDQETPAGKDGNSIRDLAVDDLKRLAARDIASARAREFVQLAEKDGWDAAIEKFNGLYRKGVKRTEEDANAISNFSLQKRTGLGRISKRDLAALEIRCEGDPMVRNILNRANVECMFMNELYAVVPKDANAMTDSGVIVDFKPNMSYYCLKSLAIHRLNQDQFDKIRNEFQDAQVSAAVHYNPENIVSRMNFSVIKEQQETMTPALPNAAPEPAMKD